MKASNYLEDITLKYFFGSASVVRPTKWYLALYKTNPTDADTGSEISGGGYVRQQITFTEPTQKSERAQISNVEKIEFPVSSDAWGEVAYFGIRDAKEGGNLLVHGAFNKPTNIEVGNKFIIEKNNLEIAVG